MRVKTTTYRSETKSDVTRFVVEGQENTKDNLIGDARGWFTSAFREDEPQFSFQQAVDERKSAIGRFILKVWDELGIEETDTHCFAVIEHLYVKKGQRGSKAGYELLEEIMRTLQSVSSCVLFMTHVPNEQKWAGKYLEGFGMIKVQQTPMGWVYLFHNAMLATPGSYLEKAMGHDVIRESVPVMPERLGLHLVKDEDPETETEN